MRVTQRHVGRGLVLLQAALLLYVFLLSIKAIGSGFKLMGSGQVEAIMASATDSRLLGLFAGVLATSLVQSSSMITALVVSLVGAGCLPLPNAIPIVMGANIGTTVTNTIVSLGHVRRRTEFRRAFAASTVHDVFNILTTLVFFPLEAAFGILERTSTFLTRSLSEAEISWGRGSPLDPLLKPPVDLVRRLLTDEPESVGAGAVMAILGLVALSASLVLIVKVLRAYMLERLEAFFTRYLFKNPVLSLALGVMVTVLVQSSSVTTSLIVPLAGAGVLKLWQVFPFTLGANLGTTVTALLGSFGGDQIAGLQVAICHCLFNVLGIAVFYPLRSIPIGIAQRFALLATVRKRFAILMILCIFFLIPLAVIAVTEAIR